MKGNKGKLALGLGILATGAGYLLFRKPPKEEEEAALSIEIRDSEGNIVPHNSPADVYEGQVYTVTVSMTNASTRGGEPVEATLELRVSAKAGGVWLIPTSDSFDIFAPRETRLYTYAMNVPWNTGGLMGAIDAVVSNPAGIPIASDTEMLNIIAVAIIYGATVNIGV